MKSALLISALILVGGLTVYGQTTAPKTAIKETKPVSATLAREKFDPTRDAAKDLLDAIAQTQKSGKRIILDVGGEWCGWCHEMDNFIAGNAGLKKLRDENYVWLKVNFSEENENKEFLAAYPQIKGYPHLYILEMDGRFLYSKDTSELEDGKKSYNLQRFTDFLNEYAPKKAIQK